MFKSVIGLLKANVKKIALFVLAAAGVAGLSISPEVAAVTADVFLALSEALVEFHAVDVIE